MMRYDEIDQTCAEITQLQATCQRLEAENAEGQRRIMELEAINADLLAALTGLLEIAELAMPPTFFQSDTRVQAALAAIAKAKQEEKR